MSGARVWRCCQCGKEEPWGKGWRWAYGFNPHLGHGVTCSDDCEAAWLLEVER